MKIGDMVKIRTNCGHHGCSCPDLISSSYIYKKEKGYYWARDIEGSDRAVGEIKKRKKKK